MLIRSVVQDEIDDDPDAAILRLLDELDEVAEVSEVWVDAVVVGDVVAVVPPWRGVEGQEPHARDPKPGEVVEAARETGQVADAVAVRVGVRAHAERVEQTVLVPALVRHGAELMRGLTRRRPCLDQECSAAPVAYCGRPAGR